MVKTSFAVLFGIAVLFTTVVHAIKFTVSISRISPGDRVAIVVSDSLGTGTYVWTATKGRFRPAITQINHTTHDCGRFATRVRITMHHTVPNSPNIPGNYGKLWATCNVGSGDQL